MNEIFNIKRFSTALKRLFIEKGVKMFGSILIIIMTLLVLLNLQSNPGYYSDLQQGLVVLALMFGPVLYMAVIANDFKDQSKGIANLLIPISRLEKWLLNNIVVIGLYFGVFSLLFRLIDYLMVSHLNAKFNLSEGALKVLPFDSDIYIVSSLVGAGVSIGVLLGSYYFKKNSLTISLFIMFGFIIFVVITDIFIANILFDGLVSFGNSAPFGMVEVSDPTTLARKYYLQNNYTTKEIAICIFTPIIAFLSLIYFVRIKEKQL